MLFSFFFLNPLYLSLCYHYGFHFILSETSILSTVTVSNVTATFTLVIWPKTNKKVYITSDYSKTKEALIEK